MFNQFEDFQKLGKDNVDAAVKSIGTATKNVQALATETADYSKKAFEHSSAVVEKLVGAKSMDKAIEIQSAYFKEAYEGFVAYASKVSELATVIAKDSMKPYESMIAKATSAVK
jgi:hypothetical protein